MWPPNEYWVTKDHSKGTATIDDTAQLGDMLRRLRAADTAFSLFGFGFRLFGRGLKVFGSKGHRYRLGRTLSEAELSKFESANQVRLPEDYRRFLSHVGNGGAGPYYGLEPLSTSCRDLSRPFPFTKATDLLTDEELDALPDREEYPGVFELCHQGCGIYSLLVMNGPTYGTIWEGCMDFYPTGLKFGEWYRRWLERALTTLDNGRMVQRLRIGMTRADVLAEVGCDWQSRPKPDSSVRYFESSTFPAQLELDENDVVIRINPWRFIVASPC